jgi:hypothetical protein
MRILRELQKRIFPTLIALTALSVSLSAAFYSVTGLSKLFAGASFQVMVMAGSLEVAKLVIASLLYQYWGQLNKILRTYLSVATVILVIITSVGIYGFLSAAYQETATKTGIVDKEVELLELRKNRFIESRDYYYQEKKSLDEGINQLRKGLSNNVIQYKDKETGQIITTTSSSNRRALQEQLKSAIEQRSQISIKLEQATDSINSIEVKSLTVETESDLAGELGPLKYLSELTEVPMNKIINYLLLVIIFVFDPLAISLVIAANFAFDKIRPKKKEVDDNTEVGPQPMILNEEVLSHIEKVLDKKVRDVSDLKEPDSEQGVMVDEEEIDEDNMYDEDYYQWEKESVEELHLQDISEDFEEDIIIDKSNQDELIRTMASLDSSEVLREIKKEMTPDKDNSWDVTLQDGLEEEEEWDEDHALDLVMNDMVKDFTEEDIQKIIDTNEEEIEPNEDLKLATEKFKEIVVNDPEEVVVEDTLKEVEPPVSKTNVSPYLRVGNRVIPRNKRYGK